MIIPKVTIVHQLGSEHPSVALKVALRELAVWALREGCSKEELCEVFCEIVDGER